MSAVIIRYPCGCEVPDGKTSCDHVDVRLETVRGWEIRRKNQRAEAQRAATEKAKP